MVPPRFLAISLTAAGCAIVFVTTMLSSASQPSQWFIILGSLLPAAGLVAALRTQYSHLMPSAAVSNDDAAVSSVTKDHADFEAWRAQVSSDLHEAGRQIDRRHRELNDRLVQFREFMEYPQQTVGDDTNSTPTQLSEKDRMVNELLEEEAGRVYEKLRNDGYKVDGKLDFVSIRDEAYDIIRRVAQVYSPDSDNPILETSFDQLARASSRVCLQALVLVEQLPVDVQHYTLAQLYNYVRKGVSAWGTWQSVSPWLTRMSRGMYAGRLAAGANPVTMGAWWLASELGRHGTNKLVNRYVDQQAVAFFNDAVRLIGNEVACVYGPGIRQRDPAWALGAELAELNYRFPQSRSSIQAGLRQITMLPLRSEYDRIYLYRCIAEHKPSGFRLEDPAVLTRDERESIANELEAFFAEHIHGATDKDVGDWRESFETLFDLRLQLDGSRASRKPKSSQQTAAIHSIHSFLTAAGGMSATDAVNVIKSSTLFLEQSLEDQNRLADELTTNPSTGFAPPDLDPADDATTIYLTELANSVARGGLYDSSLDALLVETGRYFRRGEADIVRVISDGWAGRLNARTEADAPVSSRDTVPARLILQLLNPRDIVTAIYTGITTDPASKADTSDWWLVVVNGTNDRRIVLFTGHEEPEVIWRSTTNYVAERSGGFIIDDCVLTGGEWMSSSTADRILIPGRFGTGFQTWFAPLLVNNDTEAT